MPANLLSRGYQIHVRIPSGEEARGCTQEVIQKYDLALIHKQVKKKKAKGMSRFKDNKITFSLILLYSQVFLSNKLSYPSKVAINFQDKAERTTCVLFNRYQRRLDQTETYQFLK
jgi:hypothetical protein